jgi:hypothetical protein
MDSRVFILHFVERNLIVKSAEVEHNNIRATQQHTCNTHTSIRVEHNNTCNTHNNPSESQQEIIKGLAAFLNSKHTTKKFKSGHRKNSEQTG